MSDTPQRPHWTEHYTFRNMTTGEQLSAAALRSRFERFCRLERVNFINCTMGDVARMEDGSRWLRIR